MIQTPVANVTVAGCGAMGLPMAKALLEAGYNTHGFDVRDSSEFGEFSSCMLPTLLDLPENSVALVVVRDQQQINEVCFGEHGLFSASTWPKTLIISSTVSPRYITHLATLLPPDVTLVDAPMSGAPYSAENKKLTFMLGGETAVITGLMPLFESMGSTIFHLGSLGQGMLVKVLNNYVAATNVVAVRRCIAHAESFGFDHKKLIDVMQKSSGGNWFAGNIDAIDWARQRYSPDNTIGILEKDVKCALDLIQSSETVGNPENDNSEQARTDQPISSEFDDALLKALTDIPPFPEISEN